MTDDAKPTPHKNGPDRLLSDCEQLTVLIDHPGIYLHELKGILQDAVGSSVSNFVEPSSTWSV